MLPWLHMQSSRSMSYFIFQYGAQRFYASCLHREESFPTKARGKITITKALLIEIHSHKGQGKKKKKKPLKLEKALLAQKRLPI